MHSIKSIMNKYYKNLRYQKIISMSGDNILAWPYDFAFDYSTGEVLAILIKKIEFLSIKRKLILPRDIIKWTNDIYIHQIDDMVEAKEIVRLKNIFQEYYSLFYLPVFTRSGQRIGNVKDFGVCSDKMKLNKITIFQPFKLLRKSSRQIMEIQSKNIYKISREKIIVDDSIVPVTAQCQNTSCVPSPSF